ncbi:hypothetical protein HBA54_19720 [Pelagibius litoralis]|uniref:S1 motif domain-containing protein n=1 Tax=Pelagibius litoralis TaxID=374515 RepID=A0A967F0M9_9PROT|nr:ribonuclease E/G [Pelagibius litoralis]NIA70832.1 hypothetical protein [Pelagibius litoralis]
MTAELIVSALPGEIRAAVLRDDVLEDLLVLRDGAPPQAGDLFLARVQRFDKGLEGAFVDLGLARPGLLPKREMAGPVPTEGTALPVKVLRAPAGGKGARVSAKVGAGAAELVAGQKAPARLADTMGPLVDLLRSADLGEVIADDVALLNRLKARAGDAAGFTLHAAATPLFEAFELEEQIEELLQPHADCPGGASLLIEPVRTLTAVDVNAGRHDGRGGAAAQAREVNLAAVPEIARQLRLRALSGLIVVDFLAMRSPEERKAVAAALREAVSGDPEPCQVFGLSPSGLLEMTRRRGRLPLHEVLCRPCGLGARGWEKTPETLAYEALRRLGADARGRPVSSMTLRVSPSVAAALKGGQGVEGAAGTSLPAALAAVEQRLGGPVSVVADPLVESYDLVLS